LDSSFGFKPIALIPDNRRALENTTVGDPRLEKSEIPINQPRLSGMKFITMQA
jgi:hypothetical protein